VDVTSHSAGDERKALRFLVAPYPIPRGCVAAYFPEANVLVPVASVANISNTPTSKSVVVTIEPSKEVEFAAKALLAEAATIVRTRLTPPILDAK
jgi:hypothetical protein